MTATVQPTGVVLSKAPDSGISRLNPSDGLFLRAEHLQRMQDYARELALSIGLTSGPGVVYGYQVELSDNKTLTVGTGLAINPSGQPLRSASVVELSLDKVDVAADNRFWVVQVTQGEPTLSGSENVYGNLCDDPCSPATIQPFADEGVLIQVVTDSFPGLSTVNPPSHRRNWLASRYFERERKAGGPWLVPGADGPSLSRPWSEGTAQPAAGAVPIAVLLYVGKRWVLDVWTARRDIGDPPPRCDWQWRLGLRPWSVFLAQVLQFQAQLADTAGAGTGAQIDEKRIKLIDEALAAFNALAVKPKKLGQALTDLQGAEHPLVAAADLPEQGFRELPSAGFLPEPPPSEGVRDRDQFYANLFGRKVDIRVCDCAADFALRAVEQAQHLDRIPLDIPPGAPQRPKVDVLVPTQGADLPALRATSYGWAAFVRHREASCAEKPAPTDSVDVYIHSIAAEQAPDKEAGILIDAAGKGQLDSKELVATVSYPVGGWAVPDGGSAYEKVREAWQDHGSPGGGSWAVIGLASSEERRPLAAVRAMLLTVPVDNGQVFFNIPTIYSATAMNLAKEAIVVIIALPSQIG